MDVEQLSCQELVELVTDYLEGALSPEETARFEEHIGRCARLRGLPRADPADDRSSPAG